MARIALLRGSSTRPSIPTEPLTPQEWLSFGTTVGESQEEQVPEHLRFHNPAWNLSLLRTLAQKRWEDQGGEGELGEPGPIDTSAPMEGEDMATKPDTNVHREEPLFAEIGAANILPEGRMRKKAKLDYSMFMPPQDVGDEDAEGSRRGHRKSLGDLDTRGGDKATEGHASGLLPHGGDGTSDLLPKAPYSGKKRGRRPKNFHDDSELPLASPRVNYILEPVSDFQEERRKALIKAGSKLHGMDWSKRVPRVEDELSATPPTNDPASTTDSKKGTVSYRKRVSLTPGSSQSAHHTVMNTSQQPTKEITPVEEKLFNEIDSLIIPSTPPINEFGGSSPTSSEYESVSSANQDTTFPAGQLRLTDLPRAIADTIPKTLEYFSRRDHVAPLIGGNPKVVVATTIPKSDAPIQTKGYMAIQPAWNPHAPKKAGENGSMMQLSNTSTDPVSKTQENFPLFVARGRNQWEYCGQYTVAEVVRLNAFENWMHLSTAGSKLLNHWGEEILQKKYEWAKALFIENCGWTEEKWKIATVEDVMGPILAGKVPMHWVHLQCVGFDLGFYEALLERKSKYPSARPGDSNK
ncbi:hypothetical protein TWF281_007894 [Arthrobotrys megalospora]